MPTSGYNDLGPRIDMGPTPDQQDFASETMNNQAGIQQSLKTPKVKKASNTLGLLALIVGLAACFLALWAVLSPPQPIPGPIPSPEVVPGGAAERVAKLEKDVGGLMLRLVTLEKELEALKSRAGSVNQITKLTAKVAALQGRLDSLDVDAAVKRVETQKSAPKNIEPEKKKTVEKQEKPKTSRKKLVYTVRRGDTLFTVAQRYKVRMSQLMSWNNIKRGHVLKVNEKLIIYK